MSQPIYNIRASFLKLVQPQQVVPYGLYGDIGGSLVVLMWRPPVTLFFIFQARSKWNRYQLGCYEHQTHRGGHEAVLLGRCPTSRPLSRGPASSAIMRWASRLGVPQRENSRAPSGIQRTRTLLKWVGLQLCGCVTRLARTPPNFHISHMDTSKNYPWEHCGSQTQAL